MQYNLEPLIHTFLRVATSPKKNHLDYMDHFYKQIGLTAPQFAPFLERFKMNFHVFNSILQQHLTDAQKNKIMTHYQFQPKGSHSDSNDLLAIVMVAVAMKKLQVKNGAKVLLGQFRTRRRTKKKSKKKSRKIKNKKSKKTKKKNKK